MAYTYVGEPEQAIAYADKAMRLSPHDPVSTPTLYLAKAIAFGILQDYEEALVWIERAQAAAPEMLLLGFVRPALLALAGQRGRCARNNGALFGERQCPYPDHHSMESSMARHSVVHQSAFSYVGAKIQRGPPKSRNAGVINAIARADEVIEKSGSLHVSYGSNSEVRAFNSAVRFTLKNRRRQPGLSGPKSANNGSALCSIISSQRASIFLRWSFGQPGLPQSFFISREIVGPPRAQHGFEIGNTQHGVQSPQPSHGLMCLLRPSGHCIACGGDP